MGSYFSSQQKNIDLDFLLQKATSADDPILTQAISDYQHNKQIIEHRGDLNDELKTALIHSIDEELKLVEAKQHILTLTEEIKEIHQINKQLKEYTNKIKDKMNILKRKVQYFTMIIYIMIGTIVLICLFSHFFLSDERSSRTWKRSGEGGCDDVLTGGLLGYSYRSYSTAYDDATHVVDTNEAASHKQILWDSFLASQARGLPPDVATIGIMFSYEFVKLLNSTLGYSVVITVSGLFYSTYNWSKFESRTRVILSSILSAACFIYGVLCHGGVVQPKTAFAVKNCNGAEAIALSFGCFGLGVAVLSHMSIIDCSNMFDSCGRSSCQVGKLEASIVLILSSTILYNWFCCHPVLLCVAFTGCLALVLSLCELRKISYLWKSWFAISCALLLWNWCLESSDKEIFEYTAASVVSINIGLYFYYLWKSLLKGRYISLVHELHAGYILVGLYGLAYASLFVGVSARRCLPIWCGLFMLTLFSLSAQFVVHPFVLCVTLMTTVLGQNALMRRFRLICENVDSVCGCWISLWEVMLGPIGLVVLSVVSVVPLYKWFECTDAAASLFAASRHHPLKRKSQLLSHEHETTQVLPNKALRKRQHRGFLWMYGPEFTPDLAIALNLLLLAMSSVLNFSNTMRNSNFVCIFLWISRQGFIKFEVNFILAVLFVLIGVWARMMMNDEDDL